MTDGARDGVLTLAELAAQPPGRPVALVLGVFDGVHRGHRVLLSAVREAAAARGAQPAALVFDPPPIEVIRPGTEVDRLAPLDETLADMARAGVRGVPLRFDDAMRQLPPETFLAGLEPGVRLAALVVTPDTAFGHDRAGTPERLAEIGAERGFEVVVIQPETDGDGPVSSSRIRKALADGDVALATDLLGRRPALTGTVVRGDGRGASLGYPTANLAFDYRPALPSLGIYAALANGLPAVVSIGRRPTFHPDGAVIVEAHLLDWSGDLYGATLRLELVARLRDEVRFASVPELVEQMDRDAAEARAALARIV